MADVKIVMTGHGRGEVLIDGHKIDGVRGVEFKSGALGVNVLIIDMLPERVVIEGPADVVEVSMIEVTTVSDEHPAHVPGDPRAAE